MHSNAVTHAARARIYAEIRIIRTLAELKRPEVGMLKGECKGLLELRIKVNNVQYRPLCYRGPGPREITILIGAVEKGGEFDPKNACETAFNRIELIKKHGRGRLRELQYE